MRTTLQDFDLKHTFQCIPFLEQTGGKHPLDQSQLTTQRPKVSICSCLHKVHSSWLLGFLQMFDPSSASQTLPLQTQSTRCICIPIHTHARTHTYTKEWMWRAPSFTDKCRELNIIPKLPQQIHGHSTSWLEIKFNESLQWRHQV